MATGSSLLLADDSITIQKVINLTFADEGMNVTTVGNGDLAMAKIEELGPDIVMLDVHMPGLNGYEICERLKQSDRFRHTPVILLVGSFEPFDEEEANRVGADDFLTKPFQSIRQLITKVNALLEDRPVQVSAASAADNESSGSEALEYEVAPGQDFPGASNVVGISASTPEPEARPDQVADTWSGRTNEYADDTAIDDELIEARPITGSMQQHDTYTGGSRATRPLSSLELDDMNFSHPAVALVETGPLARGRQTAVYEASDESILELGDVDSRIGDYSDDEPVLDLGETEAAAEAAAAEAAEAEGLARFDRGEDIDPAVLYGEPVHVAGETAAAEAMDTETEPAVAETEVTETAPLAATAPAEAAASIPAAAFSADQLSPEAIDAIARRVIELMSDNAVREIAWEVVPQLADLHIKRKLDEQK